MFFAKGLKFMHSNLKCFNFLCEWSSITDEGSSAWLYARPTNSHFAWYSITEIISSTHTHTTTEQRYQELWQLVCILQSGQQGAGCKVCVEQGEALSR